MGFAFYFIVVIFLSVIIPIWLHIRFRYKIKSVGFLIFLDVAIGIVVFFIGLIIYFEIFFSLFDYPKITKSINEKYYFIQEEYGWAGGTDGKHLYFYEKKHFWFDKEVGHIQWQFETGNFDAQILNQESTNTKQLILIEDKKVVLDTTLSFDKRFDFKYIPR